MHGFETSFSLTRRKTGQSKAYHISTQRGAVRSAGVAMPAPIRVLSNVRYPGRPVPLLRRIYKLEQGNTESAGECSSTLTCEMRQQRRHRFPVRHGRQSRPRRSQGCPDSGKPSVHSRAARSERRCCRARKPSRLESALPPPAAAAAAASEREGARDLVRERRWLAPDVLHIFNGRIARAAWRRRAAALLPQTSSPGRRGPPLVTTVG